MASLECNAINQHNSLASLYAVCLACIHSIKFIYVLQRLHSSGLEKNIEECVVSEVNQHAIPREPLNPDLETLRDCQKCTVPSGQVVLNLAFGKH